VSFFFPKHKINFTLFYNIVFFIVVL
jgi:hypothetical protein